MDALSVMAIISSTVTSSGFLRFLTKTTSRCLLSSQKGHRKAPCSIVGKKQNADGSDGGVGDMPLSLLTEMFFSPTSGLEPMSLEAMYFYAVFSNTYIQQCMQKLLAIRENYVTINETHSMVGKETYGMHGILYRCFRRTYLFASSVTARLTSSLSIDDAVCSRHDVQTKSKSQSRHGKKGASATDVNNALEHVLEPRTGFEHDLICFLFWKGPKIAVFQDPRLLYVYMGSSSQTSSNGKPFLRASVSRTTSNYVSLSRSFVCSKKGYNIFRAKQRFTSYFLRDARRSSEGHFNSCFFLVNSAKATEALACRIVPWPW